MTEYGAYELLAFILGSYFLPTIIACSRVHRQRVSILLLNLFLGWTFLGWVAALVWCATSDVDKNWHYQAKAMDMSKLNG